MGKYFLYIILVIILLKGHVADCQWVNVGEFNGSNFYFLNSDTGFMLLEDELYISKNLGETWEKYYDIGGYFKDPADLFFTDSNIGFAATQSRVIRTIDGGKTWAEFYSHYNENEKIKNLYFIDSIQGYLLLENNTLLKTLDGGEIWIEHNPFINNVSKEIDFIQFTSIDTGFIGGLSYLLRTTDGCRTWELVNIESENTDFVDIHFINNEIGFLLSESGILYKTIDIGENWVKYTFTSDINNKSTIHFDTDSIGYIISDSILLKTVNQGDEWISLNNLPECMDCELHTLNDSIFIYLTDSTLYKHSSKIEEKTNIVKGVILQYEGKVVPGIKVKLFRNVFSDTSFCLVDSTITNDEGEFYFETVYDKVFIGAFPNNEHFPNSITYYNDTNLEESLPVFIHELDSQLLLTLNKINILQGYVYTDTTYLNPVINSKVVLYDASNDDTFLDTTETNNLGFFEFQTFTDLVNVIVYPDTNLFPNEIATINRLIKTTIENYIYQGRKIELDKQDTVNINVLTLSKIYKIKGFCKTKKETPVGNIHVIFYNTQPIEGLVRQSWSKTDEKGYFEMTFESSNSYGNTLGLLKTFIDSSNIFNIKPDFWDTNNSEEIASLFNLRPYDTLTYNIEISDDILGGFFLSQESVILYPNPVKDQFNLYAKEEIERIEIVDLKGNICHKEEVRNTFKSIDCSMLPEAIYIVRIFYQNNIEIKQIIKLVE